MIEELLKCYGIPPVSTILTFGSGLINKTWVIIHNSEKYILQKINDNIFKKPVDIANNLEAISRFLHAQHPGYLFVTPVKTTSGENMIDMGKAGFYRMFPFVKGSRTIDVAQSPGQAYEAARQFGLFTKNLESFPVSTLNITLPEFHNLGLRYDQFLDSLRKGNKERIALAKNEIEFLLLQEPIVTRFFDITSSPNFKLRVTHHDTKISNVLFDRHDKGLCVIDLDTVMPGYFISDVGDMMRTYLSPVSEEEKDFNKIEIREAYFKAILDGYLSEMANGLTSEELDCFVYAGKFMIYMQAVRFLTDFLNNDVYYGSAYPGHNFTRAQNQVMLLRQLSKKVEVLEHMVKAAAAQFKLSHSVPG
jgi:Ser/Thr protein kinase RdoA (MazF antagonist)